MLRPSVSSCSRALTLVLMSGSFAGLLPAQQARVTVGKNILVSGSSPGRMHAEYTADADPANADRLMVCSMRHSQQLNQLTSVIYTSEDGGKSWRLGLEDSVSRFQGVWDPACTYGANGEAYFVTLILPDTLIADSLRGRFWSHQWWTMGGDHNMHVYRSMDGGRTWGSSIDLSFIDYQTIRVDHTNSKFRGRAYIYGNTSGRGVWLLYSTDAGQTWVRSERNDEDDYYPRDGTILPNGTLLLPMNKRAGGIMGLGAGNAEINMTVAASRDGGLHIMPSVKIATLRDCPNQMLGYGMASDHSTGAFRNRAYVVFPNAHRGRCLPYISWSDDDGKTWSRPVLVSDALPRPPGFKPKDHALTKVAVNKDGVVGVTWWDSGDDSTNKHIDMRFSASLDGGETWSPSVRVSDYGYVVKDPPEMAAHSVVGGGGLRTDSKPSDEANVRVLVSARSYYQGNSNPGDYTGMAASADGAFHAFFIDNRTGNGEMYTSRIDVAGTVAKPDSALAPLKNITSAIEFQYISSVWDPKTTTVNWEYQLLNSSKDTVVGPLKMRVTSLTSEIGYPTLMLDGKSIGGAGAVIDLSSLVPPGGLLPGQMTASRKLQVKITKLNSYQNDYLSNMSMKLYGTRRGTPQPDSTKKK